MPGHEVSTGYKTILATVADFLEFLMSVLKLAETQDEV